MKPYQVLLFICSVFLILFIGSLVFPEEGIRLGDSVRLKFTTIDDFLEDDTTRLADISE